jgi:hypothetical protein
MIMTDRSKEAVLFFIRILALEGDDDNYMRGQLGLGLGHYAVLFAF